MPTREAQRLGRPQARSVGLRLRPMTGQQRQQSGPCGHLTRAEAATMLKAFCENVKK